VTGAGEHASVASLSLVDFRCFEQIELDLPSGTTVLSGSNGEGKTSVLEAVVWIARGRSFRRVPESALVRAASDRAFVRAQVVVGERRRLVEVELSSTGPSRVLVDRSALARRRDLADVLRVTVFSPDDLELVKGPPAERRSYLDEVLASISPRHDAALRDHDKVLRQRNALLKGRRLDAEGVATLEVFDAQLARVGADVVRGRLALLGRLDAPLASSYRSLAGTDVTTSARYESEWLPSDCAPDDVTSALVSAIAAARPRDIERGSTSVGPHRDELRLGLDARDARTQASQGEQRSLALSMRLAAHLTVREITGITPVLALDDVFSELDGERCDALVALLPPGQALMTTAGWIPPSVTPERVLRLANHRLVQAA
jgi:DNA replication and repair protein RecF